MNQLQAFIYFLKRMDIQMIDEILSDDIYYCGTTKAIFIEKLNDIFVWNLFLENDVLPFRWAESNANCLEFFCWKQNEYENRFHITTREDGSIISFSNKRPHFGFHNSAFRVYDDEEIGFAKSPEFKYLQKQCRSALDELIDVTFTTELILNWVNGHEQLFLNVKDEDDEPKYKNIKYVEEFFWKWDSKSMERDSIVNYKATECAVEEYSEMELRDWLDYFSEVYFRDAVPRNSTAIFICDKEYRFKEGNYEYQSKELYFTEKFFQLYSDSSYQSNN